MIIVDHYLGLQTNEIRSHGISSILGMLQSLKKNQTCQKNCKWVSGSRAILDRLLENQ